MVAKDAGHLPRLDGPHVLILTPHRTHDGPAVRGTRYSSSQAAWRPSTAKSDPPGRVWDRRGPGGGVSYTAEQSAPGRDAPVRRHTAVSRAPAPCARGSGSVRSADRTPPADRPRDPTPAGASPTPGRPSCPSSSPCQRAWLHAGDDEGPPRDCDVRSSSRVIKTAVPLGGQRGRLPASDLLGTIGR